MSNKPLAGSLKAKKINKKGKRVTRNILSLKNNEYWPVIPADKLAKIEVILEKDLSDFRCCKAQIPWHLLMKMTKEQRKEKQKEVLDSLSEKETASISNCKEIRKHITIGLNSTIRNIEQKKITFCLIDSSGEPKILLEKLLSLSKENNVLAALFPGLKLKTKAIMGFPAFVLGFKATIEDEICPITNCKKIKEEILEELNLIPPAKEDLKIDYSNQTSFSTLIQQRLNDIYLYRTSNEDRIFHPSTINKKENNFISMKNLKEGEALSMKTFKRYTDQEGEKDISSSQVFDSPLILSLQNNPNKRKKK